ncbi:hypothetical protein CUN61_18055 [Pseudomonas arsenicoxydans]|uniref:Uncharacterized protein n=1 Tax=Pseudomonas arsenicoxydans TaxID=702115 RepID=A0A4P6G2U4_9PSED|nr:hypothetical protein CUN61_18055 [Pseudomonas arsenicoxydans]
MLCVGMPPGTLCVPLWTPGLSLAQEVTRSVTGCVPTQSVGTINDHYAQALKNQAGWQAASLWLWRCTPHREAEWRFCAVGNPAWMPG